MPTNALRRLVGRSRPLSSLAWHRSGDVSLARVPKPWTTAVDDGACVVRADALVPAPVLAAASKLVDTLEFDRDEDSVDGAPTFELRWAAQGEYTHAGLAALFAELIEERLLPLLRRSPLGRHELVLCEALVRSYEEGARRAHPAHYDADALVTAVLELVPRFLSFWLSCLFSREDAPRKTMDFGM